MKTFALLLGLLFLSVSPLPMVSAAGTVRTLAEIPGLSNTVLKRTLSPTIYQHLAVSPVDAWILVRGQLSGGHIFGAKVIHSEVNGVYDDYALGVTRNWTLSGHFGTGSLIPTVPVVVNVLIFEIADGLMAVSFPCLDNAGGSQLEYYGAAKLAVQQTDGHWKDLDLPQGPLKGNWAVRAGLANNLQLQLKLNQISSAR